MKFIKVTSASTKTQILINPETIGHIYSETETGHWGGEIEGRVITRIGTSTHGNGGFKALETVDEILKMLES